MFTLEVALMVCFYFWPDQALEMIQNIRASFNELLSDVPWMDETTRDVAKEKVCLRDTSILSRKKDIFL